MSVAVMAHMSRKEWAEDLAADLRGWLTFDRFGSRWDTGRRAWLSIANSPEPWGMVIQDDAIASKGLIEAIPVIRERIPADSPLVLYVTNGGPWRQTWRSVPRGTSYLVMDRIWWGVAIVLPTHLIESVIAYGDEAEEHGEQYDHRLGAWFTHNRIPVYYTWPSVVQHRRSPSLVPERTAMRQAYNFAPDAGKVNWGGRFFTVDSEVAIVTGA